MCPTSYLTPLVFGDCFSSFRFHRFSSRLVSLRFDEMDHKPSGRRSSESNAEEGLLEKDEILYQFEEDSSKCRSWNPSLGKLEMYKRRPLPVHVWLSYAMNMLLLSAILILSMRLQAEKRRDPSQGIWCMVDLTISSGLTDSQLKHQRTMSSSTTSITLSQPCSTRRSIWDSPRMRPIGFGLICIIVGGNLIVPASRLKYS